MKKYLLVLVCGMICSITAIAQKCATEILLQQKLNSDPALLATYQQQQQAMNDNAALLQTGGVAARTTGGGRTIPVVFHVLLTQVQIDQLKGMAGINERIVSQMEALNRDYNARNKDVANIPSAFQPNIGDMGLNFRLAHRDPQGKSTSGVEIIVQNSSVDGFFAGSGNERTSGTGGADAWDKEHYLNIWVVNITGFGGGVLGFTLSPTSEPLFNQVRGVTLDYGTLGQNYGNQGYFIDATDSGRTLVHEIGHFFELVHIWGMQDDCSDDDGIGDTPKQKTSNFGCPAFPVFDACTGGGSGIMFMNYMDYSDDKCILMFTKGQVAKVNVSLGDGNKTLNESGDRANWPTDVTNLSLEDKLSIYPNPTTGTFTISNRNGELQRIVISNMTGQIVWQQNISGQHNLTINLSDKAKGVYAVNCLLKEGTVTRKITIQ
jgi:hypothetical protein